MRVVALPLLLVAAPAMTGCVAAAVAAPFVAGGTLAARDVISDRNSVPVRSHDEELAESSAPLAENPTTEATGASLRKRESAVQLAPGLGEPLQPPSSTDDTFLPVLEYALASLAQEEAGSIHSAVLANPSVLDGERQKCDEENARDPAVLIDLDPGNQAFAEGSAMPSSAAASSLETLRSQGVTIAWISGNSAASADVVRDALTTSGLDPNAEDTLLLMRYPGDRKQTRRKEFAAETCLIAIAGDRRADFDELYDYLTNRDAAIRLETLINNGWFLIGDQPENFSSTARSVDEPEPELAEADLPELEFEGSPTPDEEQDQ